MPAIFKFVQQTHAYTQTHTHTHTDTHTHTHTHSAVAAAQLCLPNAFIGKMFLVNV